MHAAAAAGRFWRGMCGERIEGFLVSNFHTTRWKVYLFDGPGPMRLVWAWFRGLTGDARCSAEMRGEDCTFRFVSFSVVSS
jgi:hypothetical protein